MSRGEKYLPAAAILVAAVMLFSGLGSIPLMQPDEGRNAEVGREMATSGSWLVPTLEGHPYLDKPAAYFAAVAVCIRLFGTNEWAVRLPSALCGALILWMIYAFTRRRYDGPTAALAVIAVATSPMVFAFSRIVIMDAMLGVFVVAAILAAVVAEEGAAPDRHWHRLSAVAIGCGMLVKGPVGLLVPAVVLGVYFSVDGRPRALRRVFAPVQLLIAFAIFVPWLVALVRAHPEFLRYGVVEESYNRFFTASFNRGQPWWYYAPRFLAAIFPWAIVAVPMMVAVWPARRRLLSVDRLFIVWTLVVIVFFSLSRTKQPGYVFTAAVACAVLVARGVGLALREPEGRAAVLVRRTTLVLAGLSAASAAAVAISWARATPAVEAFANMTAQREAFSRTWPTIVAVLVLIAALGVVAFVRKNVLVAVAAYALLPLAFVTVLLPAVESYASFRSAKGMAGKLAGVPADAEIASIDGYPAGLSFYLRRTLTLISATGDPLRSNFIIYSLGTTRERPATIVAPDDRDRWLESKRGPVILLAGENAKEDLASWVGGRAPVEQVAVDWWMVSLPVGAR